MAEKARDLFKLAESLGWKLDHTTGSHRIYTKEGKRSVPIPGPANRVIGTGLAAAIKRQLRS